MDSASSAQKERTYLRPQYLPPAAKIAQPTLNALGVIRSLLNLGTGDHLTPPSPFWDATPLQLVLALLLRSSILRVTAIEDTEASCVPSVRLASSEIPNFSVKPVLCCGRILCSLFSLFYSLQQSLWSSSDWPSPQPEPRSPTFQSISKSSQTISSSSSLHLILIWTGPPR